MPQKMDLCLHDPLCPACHKGKAWYPSDCPEKGRHFPQAFCHICRKVEWHHEGDCDTCQEGYCEPCSNDWVVGGPFSDVCPTCYSKSGLNGCAAPVNKIRLRGGFAL